MTSDPPVLTVNRSLRRGLRAFSDDRLGWLDKAAAAGPLTGLRFGPVTTWVLSDADAARAMLVTDADAWVRPPALVYPLRLGVGENLFTQSPRAWKRTQPQLAGAFRARALAPRLETLSPILAAEVAAIPHDRPLDLRATMDRLVLIAASWVMLGASIERETADALLEHQRAVADWVGERAGQLSGAVPVATGRAARTMRAHRRHLREHADRVVAEVAVQHGDDVLHKLVAAKLPGVGSRRRHVRGQLIGMLLAGSETTAAALTWALIHASRNPGEWQRLRKDHERSPAFVNEVLRITPPVWGIPRAPSKAGVEVSAGGDRIRVRRGTVVTVYTRGIHRDPNVWQEPERFDPDRHIAATTDQARSMISFGLGPRSCIGQHLALAELALLLPMLADHGDVTTSGDATENPHFALRPLGDITATLTRTAS